jgi:UDP-galactopyranose mutase
MTLAAIEDFVRRGRAAQSAVDEIIDETRRKTMKKPYTYHDGAEQERSAIVRKIGRLSKYKYADAQVAMINLVAWIKERKERYRKLKGGL